MKSFARLELALAAALVVSLGGKLAAASRTSDPDPHTAAASAERMLTSAGFDARIVETSRSPRVFVEARRGQCRMIAGEYPPHSTFRDVYLDLAAPIGPLRFAHRGRLLDREPKVLGLWDFYRWRELRRIGVAAPRNAIIAVAASSGCHAETLPWSEVAALPG